LRQSAQELGAKAAASVGDLNSKVVSDKAANEKPMEEAKKESIEKTELLDVLQKMNRKVKALTQIRQQLTQKVEKSEDDRRLLREFVVHEILNGMVKEEAPSEDEVHALRSAWRKFDEERSLAIQHLQSEFQVLRMKHEAHSNEMEASRSQEEAGTDKQQLLKMIDDTKAELIVKEQQISDIKNARIKETLEMEQQLLDLRGERDADVNRVSELEAKHAHGLDLVLKQQKEKSSRQMRKIEEENQRLVLQLSSAEKSSEEDRTGFSTVKEALRECEGRLRHYEASNIDLEATVVKLEADKQELTVRVDELKSVAGCRLDSNKAMCNEHSILMAKMNEDKSRLSAELHVSRGQLTGMERDLAKSEQDLLNLLSQLKGSQLRTSQLEAASLEAMDATKRLQQQLDKECGERTHLESKIERLESTARDLEAELSDAQALHKGSESDAVRFRQDMETIQSAKIDVERELHSVRDMLQSTEKANSELQKRLTEERNKIKTLEMDKSALKTDSQSTDQQHTAELEHLKTVLREVEAKYNGLLKGKEELASVVDNEKKRFEARESELIVRQKEQEGELHLLRQSLDSTERTYVELKSKDDQERSKVEVLERAKLKLESHCRIIEQKYGDELGELKATLKELEVSYNESKKEKEELLRDMASKEKHAQGLVDQMKELEVDLEQSKLMLDNAKESNAGLQARFDEQRRKMEILETDKSRLETDNQSSDQKYATELEQLKTNVKELEEKYDKASKENLKLQRESDRHSEETARQIAETDTRKKLIIQDCSDLKATNKVLESQVKTAQQTINDMLTTQETANNDMIALQKQNADLKQEIFEKTDMVKSSKRNAEELSEKVQALSRSLDSAGKEIQVLTSKVVSTGDLSLRLTAANAEIADLRESMRLLKIESTKYSSLSERLQADKDANERSHGQKNALVAMLESQLSVSKDKNTELSSSLAATQYDLRMSAESMIASQQELQTLKAELVSVQQANVEATLAATDVKRQVDPKSTRLEALQRELTATKQQMSRKSAAAQRIIQERENENSELGKQNQLLQLEVNKGSGSDRQILELAAKQSSRESLTVSEIGIRDQTIEMMRGKLLERDGQLASIETHVEAVEGRVEELCRVRRREDVNIDYLKGTVVQYLSLPTGSSERARLLPVLATLLQFEQKDYDTIENGKKKLSWWGSSVTPTAISAPSKAS